MNFKNKKVKVPEYLYELHGEDPELWTIVATYLTGLNVGFLVILKLGFNTLPVWKTFLVFILYVDIAGGVISNFSDSTSHYYQKNSKLRTIFIFLHLLHPGLFLILFPDSLYYFGFTGFYTLIACLILNRINKTEDQQMLASCLLVIGILLSFFFNLPFKILYTFAPLFFIKLIIGFSVRRTLLSHYEENKT